MFPVSVLLWPVMLLFLLILPFPMFVDCWFIPCPCGLVLCSGLELSDTCACVLLYSGTFILVCCCMLYFLFIVKSSVSAVSASSFASYFPDYLMSFTGLHSCLFAPHLRTTGISPPGHRPARTQYASHQPASSFQAANNQYASYQLASRLACSLEPYRGSLTCPVSRRWSDRPLLVVLCWWSEQLLPPGFSLVLCQCFCLNTWCILTIVSVVTHTHSSSSSSYLVYFWPTLLCTCLAILDTFAFLDWSSVYQTLLSLKYLHSTCSVSCFECVHLCQHW